MSGRLFRFTPHGGKPNHYTDSLASATMRMGLHDRMAFAQMDVGDIWQLAGGTWERVA